MKDLIKFNKLLELCKHVKMNSFAKLWKHGPLLAEVLSLFCEELVSLFIVTNELSVFDTLHNVDDLIDKIRLWSWVYFFKFLIKFIDPDVLFVIVVADALIAVEDSICIIMPSILIAFQLNLFPDKLIIFVRHF